MRSVQLDAPPAGWGEADHSADPAVWRQFPNRVATFCLVEIQKLRHDRTEIFTRAVQPVLWLLIFGETFNRIHAIPTGGVPYLDFLAPGIIAQSGLFVAIFYGIQIIWERDAGVLTKLLVTPTPRAALIIGKSFAAGKLSKHLDLPACDLDDLDSGEGTHYLSLRSSSPRLRPMISFMISEVPAKIRITRASR